ncbi:hypothetical protein [Burkholderia sp. 22PA0106]|uniref:hypothetical protein n=1 Tax=Burkholderia sp. 22PA0106 TaxID=3237371 RepID=UPI0039C3D04D
MRIRIIENGNFTSWFQFVIIACGFIFAVLAIYCEIPSILKKVFLLGGFGIALVGGMTSRARLLKIKPFDSSYKKARKSYEVKDDEHDNSPL